MGEKSYEKMIKNLKPEDCCGCTACASICPMDAITMEPDSLSFPYPAVDSSKCIQCGACDEVCAFNELYDKSQNLSHPDVWGVRHKDIEEVMTSRSGAAFIAISDWILKRGGIVYGVGFADRFRVVHKRAVNKKERDEFKGSKYVQSDLSGIFRMVKKDLQSGLAVLFSGTPCQTAGLKAFIGKELRPKLYLTDILCRGVPSPYIWKDYLSYLEKQFGDEIVSAIFRDKVKFGWKAHLESFEFRRKTMTKRTFTRLFYKHIILRKSCGFEYVLGWLWKETAIDKVKVLLSKIQRLMKWTKI